MIVFKVLYRRLVMPFLLLAGIVGLVISLRELMYPRYPLQYRVDFNHAVTVKRRDSHLGNSMLLRKRSHPFSILPALIENRYHTCFVETFGGLCPTSATTKWQPQPTSTQWTTIFNLENSKTRRKHDDTNCLSDNSNIKCCSSG
ncbi:hypothetical protein ABKN59_001785 [Abortiporus biennis]